MKNLLLHLKSKAAYIFLIVLFLSLISAGIFYFLNRPKSETSNDAEQESPSLNEEEKSIITSTPTEEPLEEFNGTIETYWGDKQKVSFKYDPIWKLDKFEEPEQPGNYVIRLSKGEYSLEIRISGEGGSCVFTGNSNEPTEVELYVTQFSSEFVEIKGIDTYRRQSEPFHIGGNYQFHLCQENLVNGEVVYYSTYGEETVYFFYKVPENYDQKVLEEMDNIIRTITI